MRVYVCALERNSSNTKQRDMHGTTEFGETVNKYLLIMSGATKGEWVVWSLGVGNGKGTIIRNTEHSVLSTYSTYMFRPYY